MILRLIPKEVLVVILVVLTGFSAFQKIRLADEIGRANKAERRVLEIEIGLKLQTDKAEKQIRGFQKRFETSQSKSKEEITKWKTQYERGKKDVYENPDAFDDLDRSIQSDIADLLCDQFNADPGHCSPSDN